MKLVISTLAGEVYNVDVSPDIELENLKAYIQMETNVAPDMMRLSHNGQPLTGNQRSLTDLGVSQDDMLLLEVIEPNPTTAETAPPASSSSPAARQLSPSSQRRQIEEDPAFLRDMLLANPEQMALLRHNNPRLADALINNDMDTFSRMVRERQSALRQREQMRQRILTADPFDQEAQRLIAEEIRQHNIDANMEAAMEHNPESFGTVVMLYINCKVNGHPVKAFIDSGAQTTLMSSSCAERCHIMRLVDTRWSGLAKGVGEQKILGRVHMGQLQIEDSFLTSSFSILDEQPMDMLLGLDMLKRHQCVIDLNENVLKIGTTGRSTPFLAESELPACARLSSRTDEEAMSESIQEAQVREQQQVEQAVRDSTSAGIEGATVGDNNASIGGSTSQQSTGPAEESRFSEEDVSKVTAGGFSRQEAIAELVRFNGDTTQALGSLFAKSFKLPPS